MNIEASKKLKDIAKRTIRILEELERETPVQAIVEKLGVNRQLVDYYKKLIMKGGEENDKRTSAKIIS